MVPLSTAACPGPLGAWGPAVFDGPLAEELVCSDPPGTTPCAATSARPAAAGTGCADSASPARKPPSPATVSARTHTAVKSRLVCRFILSYPLLQVRRLRQGAWLVMAAPVTQKKERAAPGKYPIATIGVCTDGLAERVERPSSHRRMDASPLVMAALRNSDVGRDCGRTPGPSSRRGCSLGFVAWRSDACRGCPASVVVSVPSPTLAASSERALRSGTRGVGF